MGVEEGDMLFGESLGLLLGEAALCKALGRVEDWRASFREDLNKRPFSCHNGEDGRTWRGNDETSELRGVGT